LSGSGSSLKPSFNRVWLLPAATLGRRRSLLDTARLRAIMHFIGTTPVTLAAALLLMSKVVCAADAQGFAPDQIREGAELFAVNCSPCHGPRMQGSESAFDLRKFPPEQRDRFLSSVTRGRNQMPPWGDAFSPEQLDALWAYVIAGER
jgi:mono/diheme cytochrome c family protein